MAENELLEVIFSPAQIKAVSRHLAGIKLGLRKALTGAVADTAKQTRTFMSRQVREKVNIKKRDVDPKIVTRVKPGTAREQASGAVRLSKDGRFPIKYFGARKGLLGPTYRIGKSGGKTTALGGFGPVAKLGEHFFKREGKKRLPIRKLHGPSVWGVFVKNNMVHEAVANARRKLHSNLEHRVTAILKRSGSQVEKTIELPEQNMADPIVEQIAQKIAERLADCTVDNGCNYDIAGVIRPTRKNNQAPEHLQAWLVQGDPERNPAKDFQGNPPAEAWNQPFAIELYVCPPQDDDTPYEQIMNQFAADVRKTLTAPTNWQNWDGLAVDTKFESPERFQLEGGAGIVELVIVSVHYRISENNPYEAR